MSLQGNTSLSTHILADVESTCDHVAFLGAGQDVADTQATLISALIERGLRILEIRLGESLEATYLTSKNL